MELLYEINARLWLTELKDKYQDSLFLIDVPDDEWTTIRNKGFEWIWLMGVWETAEVDDLDRYPFLKSVFDEALPTWQKPDTVGSPYSIMKYSLNPYLGNKGDLAELKSKLNSFGIKLILDFIPNHLSYLTTYLQTNVDYFIHSKTEIRERRKLFFHTGTNYIAMGKDPHFDPWTDTSQLNIFNEKTRLFMINNLRHIAKHADGVRCDMAMLVLNDIFNSTWGWLLKKQGFFIPQQEFWSIAIQEIKSEFPEFTFIAEVYWNLECKLQDLGFDYTYDKRLYDELKNSTGANIYNYINRNFPFQEKAMRFIENHDEERAIKVFGSQKSLAAFVIISTLPGMTLVHQGQVIGKTVKAPLRLLRIKDENIDRDLNAKYEIIFQFLSNIESNVSKFSFIKITQAWAYNDSHYNITSWIWRTKQKFFLIVVNYSSIMSQANLKLPKDILVQNNLIFSDKYGEKEYIRDCKSLIEEGLFVELKPYNFHLFEVNLKPL